MQTVNVYKFGGLQGARDAGIIYCGRPTPVGNPCGKPNSLCPECGRVHFDQKMKQLTPCRSLPCYKIWLLKKVVAQDPLVLSFLSKLNQDSRLGCFCHPKACHCDIIAEVWDLCKERGLLLKVDSPPSHG